MIAAKEITGGWARAVADMYCKDLNAISDEQFTMAQPGVARNIQDLTADACAMAKFTTDKIGGSEEPFDYTQAAEAIKAEMPDRAAAKAVVTQVVGDLASAIEGASDEKLSEMVTAPWGQPMPMYLLGTIAVNHIWYHDGQINFIQAMNGDGEVHWMDQ